MNKVFIAVVVVIVVVLGGYFLLRTPTSQTPVVDQVSSSTVSQVPDSTASTSVATAVIVYNEAGYSPASLEVKVGTIVTFKNQSSRSMWPASAMHPTHRVYSGTSRSEHCPDTAGTAFDACKGFLPGESWSFTFNKVGTWKYHDHLNPRSFGTIVVVE